MTVNRQNVWGMKEKEVKFKIGLFLERILGILASRTQVYLFFIMFCDKIYEANLRANNRVRDVMV